MRLEIGILICNKICIINYDHSKSDEEQDRVEIDFIIDNPDGVKFIEIFSKGAFSKSRVRDFIEQQSQISQNIKFIKEELSTDLVLDLLRDYFTHKYSGNEFDKAVSGFNITIMPRGTTYIPSIINIEDTIIPTQVNGDRKDRTQYQFNGRTYNKKRLVLAVVQAYVAQNSKITVSQLTTIFYKDLQGSKGVVKEENEVKRECRDYKTRYFAQDHEIVRLSDGNVLVSTQWGIGNLPKFIEKAEKLGFQIIALK